MRSHLRCGRWLCVLLVAASGASHGAADIARGKAIYHLANCYSCHTDIDNEGEPLAGGRELKTAFGTFVTPNISPDRETGIGDWTPQQFIDALEQGMSPTGEHYFPAFPFSAYAAMTRKDMVDLRAYLYSLPPQQRVNRPHRLQWFVSRQLMGLWKWLNARLNPPMQPQSRGQYIVQALAHCGECHTPRNRLGILDHARWLKGNEVLQAPDLTPSNRQGIASWRDDELLEFLRDGLYPDGDYVGGEMTEVVENSTQHWPEQDLQAVIRYLRGLK